MSLRTLRLLPALLTAVAALAVPASASALDVEIVNQSGKSPDEVFVTVTGAPFGVGGMTDNAAKRLSEIPEGKLQIDELGSGRVYVSYGAPIDENALPFTAGPRFDWFELNVSDNTADKANLTAVDQFGIGMRLDSFGPADQHLEALGSANSDAIFAALQQIPGGPQATVRDASGKILRVLSPNKLPNIYPDLGDYVRSMAGQTITLRTAFYGDPFVTSVFSGSFAPDGSILLTGTKRLNPSVGPATTEPGSLYVNGADLIAGIPTGAGTTANDFDSAMTRDLQAGFSAGFWGGRYGNDALAFCGEPVVNSQGTWCPNFNRPAFGAAKLSLQPFATCEQYAAVLNQYSDAYGNPYSDDIGKPVQISSVETVDHVEVATMRLTIQPDSGGAQPVYPGNSNCGAGAAPAPVPAAAATAATAAPTAKRIGVRAKFVKKAKAKGKAIKVGRLSCSGPCGQVKAVAKRGKKLVVARKKGYLKRSHGPLKLRLTGKGKRLLKRSGQFKAKVIVWVTPPGAKSARRAHVVKLIK